MNRHDERPPCMNGERAVSIRWMLQNYLRAVARRAAGAAVLPPGGGGSRAVARARQFLENHFEDRLTLADVAAAAGTGKYYLARTFRRQTGITLFGYLRCLRTARAMALMVAGERPVDVAAAVGFSDQSHMTRVFRRQLGLTPGQFLRAANDEERTTASNTGARANGNSATRSKQREARK